jgi:hypothetical protein
MFRGALLQYQLHQRTLARLEIPHRADQHADGIGHLQAIAIRATRIVHTAELPPRPHRKVRRPPEPRSAGCNHRTAVAIDRVGILIQFLETHLAIPGLQLRHGVSHDRLGTTDDQHLLPIGARQLERQRSAAHGSQYLFHHGRHDLVDVGRNHLQGHIRRGCRPFIPPWLLICLVTRHLDPGQRRAAPVMDPCCLNRVILLLTYRADVCYLTVPSSHHSPW